MVIQKCFHRLTMKVSHFLRKQLLSMTAAESDKNENYSNMLPSVDVRIEGFWPVDDKYCWGVVSGFDDHQKHRISWDEGDVETLDMSSEIWRPCSNFSVNSASVPHMQSNASIVLSHMFKVFGNEPFLNHHAQDFLSMP